MSNINSATPAMAVVAEGKVRPADEQPSFRLMPVVIPGLPEWKQAVCEWMAS